MLRFAPDGRPWALHWVTTNSMHAVLNWCQANTPAQEPIFHRVEVWTGEEREGRPRSVSVREATPVEVAGTGDEDQRSSVVVRTRTPAGTARRSVRLTRVMQPLGTASQDVQDYREPGSRPKPT